MAGFLMYLLTSIIAYSGLLGGCALAHVAPEEIETGKRYFEALSYICFSMIMLMLFFLKEPLFGVISIIAIIIYLNFGKGKAALKIVYGVLGAVFAVLSGEGKIFMITASLIFIFGLASGTLCVMRQAKKSKAWLLFYILTSDALFFVTALPLYFLNLQVVG